MNIFVKELWLDEFTEAFQKMMRNGYLDGDLTDAPLSWTGVQCRRINGIMTCD